MPRHSLLEPIHLYWYRSMENFAIHMEEYLSGIVHFSSWQNVNDPMEGYFSYYPQHDDVTMLVSEKNRYKICCFSRTCSNYLLWSHYAKDHKGVCLEYEVIPKNLPECIILKNIVYRKEIPEFDRTKDIKDQAKKFLTHKLSFWRYEKETRLLLFDSENSNLKLISPISITFGCRFFDEYNGITDKEIEIRNKIIDKLREEKKVNKELIYYSINNITLNGEIIRSETKRLG